MDRPTVGRQAPVPPSWRASVCVTAPRMTPPTTIIAPVSRTYGIALEIVALTASSRALSKPKMASRPYAKVTASAGPHTAWSRIWKNVGPGRRTMPLRSCFQGRRGPGGAAGALSPAGAPYGSP